MVKHEKRANYKCDLCDRSYGTINKLKSHKKLVHTHVKCEECGKEISNLFQLRRHKQSVHGISPENPYQCEKCPKFFSSQTNLDKHALSKHKEEEGDTK